MTKDIAIMKLQRVAPIVREGSLRQDRFLVLREMGKSSKIITGIHKLAQFVTKILLTTQGSDTFDPNYGSSLLFQLRTPKSRSELADIQASVNVHIRDVKRQVIRSQANARLPSDERLRDLKIQRFLFSDNELKLEIDLQLTSEAGASRVLNLGPLVVGEDE
jgi:phage baseplate assembly protein W